MPSRMLRTLATLSVAAVLSQAHRDAEGGASKRAALEVNEESMLMEQNMRTLENECKGMEVRDATEASIEKLKHCVSALEDYADKVKHHEKESFAAHGRYRRAFIQTYALLKSVLNSHNELHRFRETFQQNQTNAGMYLQQQLSKVKEAAEEMGKSWAEPAHNRRPAVDLEDHEDQQEDAGASRAAAAAGPSDSADFEESEDHQGDAGAARAAADTASSDSADFELRAEHDGADESPLSEVNVAANDQGETEEEGDVTETQPESLETQPDGHLHRHRRQ